MSKVKKNFACGLALLALVMLALGSEDSEKSKTREVLKEDAVLQVSAQVLYADYRANEVAADNKYRNRTIYVSGTVKNIAKDVTDTIYITLETGEPYNSVQCFVYSGLNDKVANLSKGDHLMLKGKCEGIVVGTVVLRGCIFVVK